MTQSKEKAAAPPASPLDAAKTRGLREDRCCRSGKSHSFIPVCAEQPPSLLQLREAKKASRPAKTLEVDTGPFVTDREDRQVWSALPDFLMWPAHRVSAVNNTFDKRCYRLVHFGHSIVRGRVQMSRDCIFQNADDFPFRKYLPVTKAQNKGIADRQRRGAGDNNILCTFWFPWAVPYRNKGPAWPYMEWYRISISPAQMTDAGQYWNRFAMLRVVNFRPSEK